VKVTIGAFLTITRTTFAGYQRLPTEQYLPTVNYTEGDDSNMRERGTSFSCPAKHNLLREDNFDAFANPLDSIVSIACVGLFM